MSAPGGGVLFSKYIDDNILTPLLSRLQVITDDERFRGSDLLEDLDGVRAKMRDLRAVFAGMAENERSLVHQFDPVERLVDDVLEPVAAGGAVDVAKLQRKLSGVREHMGAINEAIVEYSRSMVQRKDQASSGGPAPAPAAERVVYHGGEHMEHLRRGVRGMDLRLRHCLLCLAAFPEGAVVKKRLLIHWWMGEGFVESAAAGKQRFQQLVGMGFVRAVRRGHCDTAHACTVHPWVRRALVAVARDTAFLDADLDGGGASWARRACLRDRGDAPLRLHPDACTVYNVDQKYVRLSDAWFGTKAARLGTVQLGQWRAAAGEQHEEEDPKSSHVELVADEHLRGIGACRSLRYLSLRGISRIKAVPDAIGKLGDLVVLDLRACHNLQALTREVTKLHSLQYLDVSECYLLVDMPEGLAKLSKLQVLKGFVLPSSSRRNACRLRELAALTALRKLSIVIGKKLKRAEADLAVLSKLTSLTSLKITWGMLSSQGADGEQCSVDAERPLPFALPSALSKLQLCCFPCREFTELVKPDGFPRLKRLYVTGGKLRRLGPPTVNGECTVEVLRLRCLKHLQCDWAGMHQLYAQLRCVQAHSCPAAHHWPLDEKGLWRKSDEASSQQQAAPGGTPPEIVRDGLD